MPEATQKDFQPSNWGKTMGGYTELNPAPTLTSKVVIGSNNQAYTKLSSGGYINNSTGEQVSGISTPSKGSNIRYSPGVSFGGGGGGGQSPLDFYLGPAPTLPELKLPSLTLPNAPTLPGLNLPNAPTLPGLNYTDVFSNFKSTFNLLNTGVNPQFGVDTDRLASDAKSMAAKLNLSPSEIKGLVAGINPSTGEIISDVQEITSKLNNPAKIAAESNKLAEGLNAKYQAAFNAAMPGYSTNMAKANAITSDYLAGKLPADVVDAVYRGAASKGFTAGIFGGGLGRNIVAKDLGITSLQLQSAGANLLQQTANIANSVLQSTMPVTGESFASRMMTDPNQIFSTVSNMKRVDPNTIFNAVYTPTSQVYNTMSQMAQQSTMARANFEASKLVAPTTVLNALTQQAQYNQQVNTQNLLNQWETMKTMATQNNQISQQNALNQWQTSQTQALNNWQTKLSENQYNNQIQTQNLLNRYQSQALPGQFDISKGQYVSFTPGQYQSTVPTQPGLPSAGGSGPGGGMTLSEQVRQAVKYLV